jgi:hypothetical protein
VTKKQKKQNTPVPEAFVVKTKPVPETPADFEIENALKHKNVHHMAELISKVLYISTSLSKME